MTTLKASMGLLILHKLLRLSSAANTCHLHGATVLPRICHGIPRDPFALYVIHPSIQLQSTLFSDVSLQMEIVP